MYSTSTKNPQTPEVRMVVAYSQNRVIGKDNTLIWRLPGDLQHFKRQTLGHPIVMGRNTWESLGRPLPGRQNIVLTRQKGVQFEGATVFSSLEDALAQLQDVPVICIIGGAQIYEQALPWTDQVIATEVQAEFEGDAFFPPLTPDQWQETSRQTQPPENGLSYDFVTYDRISSKSS